MYILRFCLIILISLVPLILYSIYQNEYLIALIAIWYLSIGVIIGTYGNAIQKWIDK